MINYSKPNITVKDIKIVNKVLNSGFVTQGEVVNKFEKNLTKYFGSKYSCSFANGTMALYILGMALGWGENDVVVTTPNTFLASANCVIFNNANLKFIDINPNTLCIDTNKLKEFLINSKRKISAVIGVDFAGNACDWEEMYKLKKKYNFILINDNCHAIGTTYKNSRKYASKYSDFVVHSYHGVKNITTGEGGAVLTDNLKIYKKIRNLSNHGTKQIYKSKPWEKSMINLGYNSRLSDIACALGISQLQSLNSNIQRKKVIAQRYRDNLNFSEKINFQEITKKCVSSYHLFPIQFDLKRIKKTKNQIFQFFYKNEIKLQSHYPPIHLNPFYKKKFKYKKGDFPNSEKYYERSFSFPCYPSLSDKNLKHVISCIKEVIL